MEKITISVPVPKFIITFSLCLLLRYKKICYGDDLRFIPLNNGKYAIVDSADFEKINKHKWGIKISTNTIYAIRMVQGKNVYMHNQIMQPPAGFVIDHKDRNGLNNSRRNLRLATKSQNCCNHLKKPGCSSKYRGVCFHKGNNKWVVYIKIPEKRLFLGYFENEIDAAKAYDTAAKKYHGEFAVLNFPNESQTKTFV
ncbi:MAG: HNH endonuclease [Sedimentisphaerales bacterium]